MSTLNRYLRLRPWLAAMLLSAVAAGCGGGDGGRDPILGFGDFDRLPPSVTTLVPVDNATGVARQNTVIAAVFSEPMTPITGAASFTLTCAAPCISPTGTVSLDGSNRVATLALASGTNLSPLTVYTATVTGARSLASGLSISSPSVWRFTTGETAAPTLPPLAPTVIAVSPLQNATGVALNNAVISADFSQAMTAINGTASFTLSCLAPCTSPTGAVTLDPTNRVAVFALPSGASLAASTTYTATITGARSLASGLAMASPYVWQFKTGLLPDTTRPRVVLTAPTTTIPGPTPGAPANEAITAVFSEDMAPASLAAATFRLRCAAPCVAPAGSVNYIVGNRTAVFTPTAALAVGTTYTATITLGATDLAGNALAGNQAALPAASAYVWTFVTAAAAPTGNISVLSTHPAAGTSSVCTNASVNATFNVPSGLRMNPATVNAGVFTVTGPAPGLAPVAPGAVSLDVTTGRIASFTPLGTLTAGITYTARILGGDSGVKDLAVPGNAMLNDFSWTFSTVDCAVPPIPVLVPLGAAEAFGTFGGSAGMTSEGLYTVVNGDIGTTAISTAVTGFHDAGPGCTYTETPLNVGTVNGKIYTAAPPPTVACPSEGTADTFAMASAARADALAAYNTLVAMPGGPDPGAGNLANLTLAPGVYTAASGAFTIEGGDLTLDANGNANAVWVFQMASTLTVGGPGAAFPQSIILANGAQAKNVFWQVGTFATINAGGGGTMVGTIISQAGASFSTSGNVAIVTLNGRALSLGASVTLVNTVVNVPAQ